MKRWLYAVVLATVCGLTSLAHAGPGKPDATAHKVWRVGVTLHPYYSWTRNVVGDLPFDVVPVIPGDIDIDHYQPRPDDIATIGTLDAIVINGIGHDAVIDKMIAASGNTHLLVIRPNDGTPIMRGAHGEAQNSHTFLSITNAIQQSYFIAKALGTLDVKSAPALEQHAGVYAKRLRAIKLRASEKLAKAELHRVVTVHDGYGYLLQELGLELVGVVEPSHGLLPSAQEFTSMIDLVKREHIRVVLSEEGLPTALAKPLEEAGARSYVISHVATGAFTDDKFEREMSRNLDTLTAAVQHP